MQVIRTLDRVNGTVIRNSSDVHDDVIGDLSITLIVPSLHVSIIKCTMRLCIHTTVVLSVVRGIRHTTMCTRGDIHNYYLFGMTWYEYKELSTSNVHSNAKHLYRCMNSSILFLKTTTLQCTSGKGYLCFL